MGSATRSALEAARTALSGAKNVDHAAGEQLLAAARTIADSPQLLAALMSTSSGEKGTVALVSTVFSSLSPASRSLLEGIATSRWSSSDDLLAGIEEIGIRAIAATAPRDGSLERELFEFGRVATSEPDLELALSSKRGGAEGKRSLVDSLLGSASAQARAIASHLVQQPRGRRLAALVSQAVSIVADVSGKGVATVSVARPLTSAQRSSVEAAITARYGREHVVNQVVDPALIGGVRIQVGDEVIDGSIAARLADLSLQLAS